MKIITISREFGSGGRELGKRLAELLHYDYYDREIITASAEKKELNGCCGRRHSCAAGQQAERCRTDGQFFCG